MKMYLHPSVIYRVPQFPQNASIEEVWKDFKKSIELSSKSFYNVIEDLTFEQIDSLPPGVGHTLWKYFNRAINRATPYNSFGAIGCVHFGNKQQIRISNDQTLHNFMDWTYAGQAVIDFNELLEYDAKLFANSSYYKTGSEIRYVSKEDSGYELVDYPYSELNLDILRYCSIPIRISDLRLKLNQHHNQQEIEEAIQEMITDQLLFSSRHPNIIGEEYFKRAKVRNSAADKYYIIAQRPLIEGELEKRPFKDLPELINKLHQFLPSYTCDDLDKFKEDFVKKFGDAQVPLMLALDPECGIRYGNIKEDNLTSDLVNQLSAVKTSNKMSTADQLMPLLLGTSVESIDFNAILLPEKVNNLPLPNSISILCTLANDLVQLEHVGGITATSLLGRFTLVNKDILTLCREMVSVEKEANPEVIFFDIAYLVGNNIDNVNRRELIYDHQLSLLNYDTSIAPLVLNDVIVSIQGDQVVLHSKGLKKRLVPRLASAYNYLLSDLPVFRFLCDLQTQGVHKNLDLRLPDRISNLDYYPRLQYKNIILSPRTWRIKWNEAIFGGSEKNKIANFKKYLFEKGISPAFRYGQGDQTLGFHLENEQDLKQLLMILKKLGSLYIEEVITSNNEVLDQKNNSYQSQYILSLFHRSQIYHMGNSVNFETTQMDSIPAMAILPGSDWLYYEIYCHPTRSNEILLSDIKTLLRSHQPDIRHWFFIRYSKNGNHIRLRLQLKDIKDGQMITAALAKLIQSKVDIGIVSDFAIKIYRPEYERYGIKYMDAVHKHFQHDSEYVLHLLGQQLSDLALYQRCTFLFDYIEKSKVLNNNGLNDMVTLYSNMFNSEHTLSTAEFKLLNKEFARSEDLPPFAINHTDEPLYFAFLNSLTYTLSLYDKEYRERIFASLVHMHVNRLFHAKQRVHEMVIYYLMEKQHKKRKTADVIHEISSR